MEVRSRERTFVPGVVPPPGVQFPTTMAVMFQIKNTFCAPRTSPGNVKVGVGRRYHMCRSVGRRCKAQVTGRIELLEARDSIRVC